MVIDTMLQDEFGHNFHVRHTPFRMIIGSVLSVGSVLHSCHDRTHHAEWLSAQCYRTSLGTVLTEHATQNDYRHNAIGQLWAQNVMTEHTMQNHYRHGTIGRVWAQNVITEHTMQHVYIHGAIEWVWAQMFWQNTPMYDDYRHSAIYGTSSATIVMAEHTMRNTAMVL